MTSEWNLPIAAERLIPHRLPMRLIDELLECGDGAATVAATVAEEGLLTTGEGRLAEVALLEMLAQSFAALQGFEDCRQGKPVRKGFLVGVRTFRLNGKVRAGDLLHIHLRMVASMGGFAMAEGEIRRADEVLAVGSLKLWIPEENEEQD